MRHRPAAFSAINTELSSPGADGNHEIGSYGCRIQRLVQTPMGRIREFFVKENNGVPEAPAVLGPVSASVSLGNG